MYLLCLLDDIEEPLFDTCVRCTYVTYICMCIPLHYYVSFSGKWMDSTDKRMVCLVDDYGHSFYSAD